MSTPKLKWHPRGTKPRKNSHITFDWCGTRFTGEFIDDHKPWGIAWQIEFAYFAEPIAKRWVTTNQIEQWAYTDGS